MQISNWSNGAYSNRETSKSILSSSNTFWNPNANDFVTLLYSKNSTYQLSDIWKKTSRNNAAKFSNTRMWNGNRIPFVSIMSKQHLITSSETQRHLWNFELLPVSAHQECNYSSRSTKSNHISRLQRYLSKHKDYSKRCRTSKEK